MTEGGLRMRANPHGAGKREHAAYRRPASDATAIAAPWRLRNSSAGTLRAGAAATNVSARE